MSTVEPGGELPVGAPGPTVLRMMLGNQLHQLREAAGVTPEQAGYEIRASRSKILRIRLTGGNLSLPPSATCIMSALPM